PVDGDRHRSRYGRGRGVAHTALCSFHTRILRGDIHTLFGSHHVGGNSVNGVFWWSRDARGGCSPVSMDSAIATSSVVARVYMSVAPSCPVGSAWAANARAMA